MPTRHIGSPKGVIAPLLVFIALAQGTVGCAELGITEVRVADDPGAVAEAWLRQQAGNTSCFGASDIDYYFPPTLEAADNLTGVDRWLNPDTKIAFVGDFRRATFEPTGASVAWAPAEAWVMRRDKDGPTISQFMALISPKGRTVWVSTSTERALPTAACETSTGAQRVTFSVAD